MNSAVHKTEKTALLGPAMASQEESVAPSLRGDLLIVFQTIVLPLTFIITYFIATALGHVEKEFPYISDTGTWPPESCIFGTMLCFYSLSSFLCVHIRWRIIRESAIRDVKRINNVTFGLGVIAAFGVLLVANFQETSQIIVHLIGAMMAFYIGTVYMWLQTFLSWRVPQVPGFIRPVLMARVILAVLATISAILITPFAATASAAYNGNGTKTYEPGTGKWDSDLGGNDLHIASAAFEWALAGLVTLYFLSFLLEFKRVRFGMPRIMLEESTTQQIK